MTVKDSNQTDNPSAPSISVSTVPDDAVNPKVPGQIRSWLRRSAIGLAIVGIVVGGRYVVYRQVSASRQQATLEQVRTVALEQTSLSVTVSANGTVEPEQTTNVSPKNSGRLEQVVVSEGDYVETGQILAYMDDSNLQGDLLQAQGQLESAVANLAMMEAGNRPQEIAQATANLASAEADLRQAEADLDRYEQLYTEGAIAAQEVDSYRTAQDTAQAQVDAEQHALSLVQAGYRQEEIDQARAQVTEAQGNLTSVTTQIEDTIIRAPFSGIVTARYADPGDFVAPTTAASETSSATSSSILSLASTYQVVANVSETDIARIQPGQSVTVTADAYSEQTFSGTVAQVAEQATVSSNVTSFEVRVDIDDSQRQLSPGMNVDVEFQVESLDHVWVVPTVAIVRQETGEGVMVLTGEGEQQFQAVETGITVGNQTEVTSGLNGDEQVIVNVAPPSDFDPSSDRRLPDPLGAPSGRPPGGQP